MDTGNHDGHPGCQRFKGVARDLVQDIEWQGGCYRWHGIAIVSLAWHHPGSLAGHANPVGFVAGGASTEAEDRTDGEGGVVFTYGGSKAVSLQYCASTSAGGDIPDGFEEPPVVEPVNPLERGDFHRLTGFPGASGVNQFRFVEAVDGFFQGVIVTIPLHLPFQK